GWGWQVTLHPEDLPKLMEIWKELLATGKPGEIEARLRRHDGVYRWFLFRVNPLRDESGRIVKWYGTNTDIDDLKRAEQRLQRSETLLSQAQGLTRTGSAWVQIRNHAITEIVWSDETARQLGFPTTVKPTVELVLSRCHPGDLKFVVEKVRQLVME